VSAPLGGQTVELLHAPLLAPDRYGATRRDWGNATHEYVEGCAVQPISATEGDVDREYANTHWRVYIPGDVDLESADRMRIDGVLWEVDGNPAKFVDEDLYVDHVEADIKRVTG